MDLKVSGTKCGALELLKHPGFRPAFVIDVGANSGTHELYDTFPDSVHLLIEHVKRIIAWCIALAAAAASAQEPNVGMGYYGMMHPQWPCAASLSVFDGVQRPSIAVLWNTFGTETACMEKFLADPRPKFFELHLVNTTCQTNSNCAPYEFLDGIPQARYDRALASRDPATLNALAAYAKHAADWLLPRLDGKTECAIDVFLEDTYSVRAIEAAFATIGPIFPGCKLVRSVRGSNRHGGLAGAAALEGHGDPPNPYTGPPCIVDLDGDDINLNVRPAVLPQFIEQSALPAYIAAYQKCSANFLWIAEFNGVARGAKIPPRERVNWPSAEVLGALAPYLKAPAP